MNKIYFYAPKSHVEQIKTAMFERGAGKIGEYDCCSWQTLGEGQFRPLEKAQAFIGETGEVETVSEYKVEMVCENECLDEVLQAMKAAHPYETPAYGVIEISL